MKKINGPKLDLIIMAGHIQMMNWDAVEKYRKSRYDWILAIILVTGLVILLAVR